MILHLTSLYIVFQELGYTWLKNVKPESGSTFGSFHLQKLFCVQHWPLARVRISSSHFAICEVFFRFCDAKFIWGCEFAKQVNMPFCLIFLWGNFAVMLKCWTMNNFNTPQSSPSFAIIALLLSWQNHRNI